MAERFFEALMNDEVISSSLSRIGLKSEKSYFFRY